jgi:predicted transcriptional regulator
MGSEKGFGGVLVQTIDEMRLSHRGRLDIIANILNSAVGGVRKTSIMYKCNLSFKQLEVYLGFLLTKDLLRMFTKVESEASQFFETTERGMDFLRAYRNLDALMST